jgi:hypothetical protein
MSNFKILNLRYNKIKTLPDGFFSGLNSVEIIDIGYNEMNEIDKMNFSMALKI